MKKYIHLICPKTHKHILVWSQNISRDTQENHGCLTRRHWVTEMRDRLIFHCAPFYTF